MPLSLTDRQQAITPDSACWLRRPSLDLLAFRCSRRLLGRSQGVSSEIQSSSYVWLKTQGQGHQQTVTPWINKLDRTPKGNLS